MSYDEDVTVLRKKITGSQARSATNVNRARAQGGAVETTTKFGAASNKAGGGGLNAAKLDRETEELKHKTVERNVAKLIQQGRAALGLNQKELAMRIGCKPQIINEYEQGKGIPDNAILSKIQRVIKIKLTGKNIGEPLNQPKPSAGGAKKKKK